MSSDEPFPWAVTVTQDQAGRWCATQALDRTRVAGDVGPPCGRLLTPEQAATSDGLGTTSSVVLADTATGPPTRGLSWGFAPAGVDEVIVLLDNGTRTSARLATHDAADVTLWAIGYTGV